MLSHTHLGVSGPERAVAFYRAVMEVLGYEMKFHEPERGWAGWMRPGHPRPVLLIGRPHDGRAPAPGNGVMVALLAPDRPAVDRAHGTALAHGGTDEGAPGPRAHYHPHYHGGPTSATRTATGSGSDATNRRDEGFPAARGRASAGSTPL